MSQTEYGRLAHVWVRKPSDAFQSQEKLDAEWRGLGYAGSPDLGRATTEFEQFTDLLESGGADVVPIPPSSDLSIDSIYVRDASIVTDDGLILCNMGKESRAGEPEAHRNAAAQVGVPVIGAIEGAGRLEGGDFVWLAPGVAAVGLGYRTNQEGIGQLGTHLAGRADELIVVPLPHWRGPGDVFHLMSIISPVDADLAVVYSPLMPVPFRTRLLDLGIKLVEVPDEEFESMGANVLALGPRTALMLEGNPITRARLEAAGCEVLVYEGSEISSKGCGGPTCLTRPLVRRP